MTTEVDLRRRDYATGKPVGTNPEEAIRQEFERILIDDLGYPREHIDIEVPIQRGSNRKSERADIVVYDGPLHRQENAYIIIEIETPNVRYDRQALSYATATTAPYVVWFGGLDARADGPYYHYRDLQNAPTKFVEIPALPRFGESYETLGRYRKSDLKPAKALKLTFQKLYNALYGSGPIKREESITTEVIKLIFCKIKDETKPDELCEFRATPLEMQTKEGLAQLRTRIEGLYRELLDDPDLGDMFRGEGLEYSDERAAFIVAELQGLALMHPETNTDALGDAYEVLLPSTLKGESGQFFTPREIVRFAIDVIDPRFDKNELILDPACGSGGFLSVALEKLRGQIEHLYAERGYSRDRISAMLKEYAGKYIFGSDIDNLLYRIAKSYMAIVGDGRSNIFNADSLLPADRLPAGYSDRIKPNSVDVITTNPPFGTKIDDTRGFVLDQFEVGHRLTNGKADMQSRLAGQDPDKLFLERDIQYLKTGDESKPGGRMVIVLPKQNLSGADTASVEVRKWLLRQGRILAVVDLPREAFQPHTGTKTSLVFFEKTKDIPDDYPIFMAVANAVGHDRRGNPLFRKSDDGLEVLDSRGEPQLWNDLPLILEAWQEYLRSGTVQVSDPSSFVLYSSKITKDPLNRLDAWFWDPNKNDVAKLIEDSVGHDVRELARLGDLVEEGGIFYPGRHKRNYVENSPQSVPFYSGTQVLQVRPFDLKYQPRDYAPARKHFVKKGWILITRSGSTGRVTITPTSMDGAMVSEHVIRVVCDPSQIDPYYLYAYLSSEELGKVLLEKGIYASVVDHISPDFVSTLPVPRLEPSEEKRIAEAVREAEEARDRANRTLALSQSEIASFINRETPSV